MCLHSSVWEDTEISMSAICQSQGETVFSCLTAVVPVANQILVQVPLGEGGHRTTAVIQNPAMDGDLGDGKEEEIIWGILVFRCQLKGSDAFSFPFLQYQVMDGHDRFLIIHICEKDPEGLKHGIMFISILKLKAVHLYLIIWSTNIDHLVASQLPLSERGNGLPRVVRDFQVPLAPQARSPCDAEVQLFIKDVDVIDAKHIRGAGHSATFCQGDPFANHLREEDPV